MKLIDSLPLSIAAALFMVSPICSLSLSLLLARECHAQVQLKPQLRLQLPNESPVRFFLYCIIRETRSYQFLILGRV